MSVWVLVFYMASTGQGGPAVIDNIATMQECERVQALIPRTGFSARCIEVRKVKP